MRSSRYPTPRTACPRRTVFVGGGYISFEFAHVSARAGAEATILHAAPHPLKGFDLELVDRLAAASRAAGIQLGLNARVAVPWAYPTAASDVSYMV